MGSNGTVYQKSFARDARCHSYPIPQPLGVGHTTVVYALLFSTSGVGSFTSHMNRSVKVLWDGTYGFLSLSEKTRKSNYLQMSLQRQHFLHSYLFKDPECCSDRGLSPRPPARQTGALPTELTRRRLRHMFGSETDCFWIRFANLFFAQSSKFFPFLPFID